MQQRAEQAAAVGWPQSIGGATELGKQIQHVYGHCPVQGLEAIQLGGGVIGDAQRPFARWEGGCSHLLQISLPVALCAA